MSPPSVFISYSHDSPEHKQWVLRLANDLLAGGVDATLDQWDLVHGQDLATFMHTGITTADHVLLICSENYVSKADAGVGGVGYEKLIVSAEVVESIGTTKFIPLIRNNESGQMTPKFLGPRYFINFTNDANYADMLEELLRALHKAPAIIKPSVGPNPFSGETPKAIQSSQVAKSVGGTASDVSVLESAWFESEQVRAEKGLSKLGLTGGMELRFALHHRLEKSPVDLLNAVRRSEIHTFGWPIGVTLENRPEYCPRPFGDGIRAEVAISEELLSGRVSYDYWAARKNGDFFLLQSFFEDRRGMGKIYLDTQIKRATEALLFASNLYSNLGAPNDSLLSIRMGHRGLVGRELTSAYGGRYIHQRKCHESSSMVEIEVVLGLMKETLVDDVRALLGPFFMLFDFMELEEPVYRDIVRGFEKGEIR